MVKIRLQRRGRKKRPYYHIVAADTRSPRDGRIIEDLGRYNPLAQPNVVRLETDRIIYWLNTGAQPSDTVRNLLKTEGIYYRMHLQRWNKSEEEIEQTISEWKGQKDGNGEVLTPTELKKAALKAEQEKFEKEQEELAKKQAEAEAKAKKEAEEKAAAEAKEAEAKAEEAAAEEVKEEAKADEADEVSEEKAETAEAEEAKKADEPVAEEVKEEAKAETETKAKEEKKEEPKAEADKADAGDSEKESK